VVKVYIVYFVSALVIGRQYSRANESFADLTLWIVSASVFDLFDEVQHVVSAEYLVGNVDIEHDTFLKCLQGAREARPDLNVVVRQSRALVRVEEVATDLLELDPLEHRVEEGLKECQHVLVLAADGLDPLDADSIGDIIIDGFEVRDLLSVLERIDNTVAQENEEVQILSLQYFSYLVEHLVSCFLRILRNLWVELDTVLEHSFLLRIREVELVIVSKQAHWLGLDRSVSALLRSGSDREAHCFYLKSYKFLSRFRHHYLRRAQNSNISKRCAILRRLDDYCIALYLTLKFNF